MALELSCGTDPSYVNTLPSTFGLLFGNGGWLSTKIRIAVSHLRSPIQPSPVIPNETLSWSIKNTIFAAQTFMLAATANGLGTAPMEGFDERRLCQSLNIPTDRYAVPLVISVGYPKEEVPLEAEIQKVPTTRRYPLSDICFSNSFGTPTSY